MLTKTVVLWISLIMNGFGAPNYGRRAELPSTDLFDPARRLVIARKALNLSEDMIKRLDALGTKQLQQLFVAIYQGDWPSVSDKLVRLNKSLRSLELSRENETRFQNEIKTLGGLPSAAVGQLTFADLATPQELSSSLQRSLLGAYRKQLAQIQGILRPLEQKNRPDDRKTIAFLRKQTEFLNQQINNLESGLIQPAMPTVPRDSDHSYLPRSLPPF